VSPSEHSVLDVAGIQSAHIHTMWNVLMYVCGSMYLLVIVFLVWALLRARRARAAPAAADSPGITFALRGWIGIVVVGLFGLTIASYATDRALYVAAQPHGLTLKVTSQQWWWAIEYVSDRPSEHFQTANEIHLPVNVPVAIQLSSPDVIHSFWVPNLHGKQDLIPGRDTDIHLQPTRTGVFRGQCAEFCGAQHANMAIYVIVESREDFEKWKARQLQPAVDSSDAVARRGRAAFMSSACPLCHTIRGTDAGGVSGPDLTHLASRMTLAAGAVPNGKGNLAAWIGDPQGVKPGNHMPRVSLGSEDLQSIATYLNGLE
jgi:cytochrome c oxidase subunit II